jgi:predicted MPP superfamily phosphohydrolase
MYDLVGDIHGFDEPFVELLDKLGYAPVDGVWQHPSRTLISLGDLIDRGPGQKRVVDILKTMQEHGKAVVIMGNHEFYAIAWHLRDAKGKPLRPHTEKNFNEHRAFLEQAVSGSKRRLTGLKRCHFFIKMMNYGAYMLRGMSVMSTA